MARINIDDDLDHEPEFWLLMKLCNFDRKRTLGCIIEFWRLAQKRYVQGETVSREDLIKLELECMIDAGWAIPFKDGFQAKDAEKRFGWHLKKVEAGRKGGLAKASSASECLEPPKQKLAKASSASECYNPAPESYPPTLTLTLAPSLSLVTKEEEEDVPTLPTTQKEEKNGLQEDRRGPLDMLLGVEGASKLSYMTHSAQESLLIKYGLNMIFEHLPLASLKWDCDPTRTNLQRFPLFFRSWLQNEARLLSRSNHSHVRS